MRGLGGCTVLVLMLATVVIGCSERGDVLAPNAVLRRSGGGAGGGGGGGSPGEEAGNNLSFPVVFSDGITKDLRGTYDEPDFRDADMWYVWPDSVCMALDLTCPGDEDATTVWQQQGDSEWQAESVTLDPNVSGNELYVDWIDWGDNLESVPWYLNSKVRTEVVLIQDLVSPMTGFEMAWISGLGMNELWGTTQAQYYGMQATVYSACARLYIQKLYVAREEIPAGALVWNPVTGWTGTDPEGNPLIGDPIVDKPVWDDGDGPSFYSAEINVKGKIIYGYNWDVSRENDGDGDYRITFALDEACGGETRNTMFDQYTEILVPSEEEAVTEGEPVGEGGITGLDYENDLTYIDVMIKGMKGQKGGKNR